MYGLLTRQVALMATDARIILKQGLSVGFLLSPRQLLSLIDIRSQSSIDHGLLVYVSLTHSCAHLTIILHGTFSFQSRILIYMYLQFALASPLDWFPTHELVGGLDKWRGTNSRDLRVVLLLNRWVQDLIRRWLEPSQLGGRCRSWGRLTLLLDAIHINLLIGVVLRGIRHSHSLSWKCHLLVQLLIYRFLY